MIFTLYVEKNEQSLYRARILDSGVQIAEMERATLSEVIEDCAAAADVAGLYGYHIWYGPISLGTKSITAMRCDAVNAMTEYESPPHAS